MQAIKLYAAKRLDIKPNATTLIPVKGSFNVPLEAVGKFFIRLCLSERGLVSGDSPFRPGWCGTPKGIVVINAGANVVEILEGDELGEVFFLALAPTNPRVGCLDQIAELHKHH